MMQAGKYWVGDLCYVMTDPEWDEVLELIDLEDQPWACGEGEFTFKDGRRFAMYNTKYGDGTYKDQHGLQYGVDSGSIGCIRVEDIRGEYSFDGSIVVFKNDFSTRNENDVIHIGHVRIDTSCEEEYCDEDAY